MKKMILFLFICLLLPTVNHSKATSPVCTALSETTLQTAANTVNGYWIIDGNPMKHWFFAEWPHYQPYAEIGVRSSSVIETYITEPMNAGEYRWEIVSGHGCINGFSSTGGPYCRIATKTSGTIILDMTITNTSHYQRFIIHVN